MPINPIGYQDTTQFLPVSSFLTGMKFMQDREQAKADLESAKLRNRLYDMSLKEAESERAFRDEIANSLLIPQNVKNVTVKNPVLSNVPLQAPGGAPTGWTGEPSSPAPIVGEQSIQLPQMTTEQFNNPAIQDMLNGLKYDVTDEQITPFLDEAKQYGVTEQMLRSNPQAAMAFIEKKKADATALMDKKINMIKDLNAINPAMATSIWNSDPMLAKMGKMETARNGDAQEVKVNGEVIGYNIRKPDGKYEFREAGARSINDFKAFYNGYKEEHPQAGDADISRAWHQMKMDESNQRLKLGVTLRSSNEDAVESTVDHILQSGIYDPTTYSIRNGERMRVDNALRARLELMGDVGRYGTLLQAGKFFKDALIARAIPLIDTAIAQVDEVEDALSKFKPGQKIKAGGVKMALDAFNAANKNPDESGNIWDQAVSKFEQYIKEQKLSPAQRDYETTVFYYIRESNRALTNSSATAQESYNQEAQLFARESSADQIRNVLKRSKNTLRNARKARTSYYGGVDGNPKPEGKRPPISAFKYGGK